MERREGRAWQRTVVTAAMLEFTTMDDLFNHVEAFTAVSSAEGRRGTVAPPAGNAAGPFQARAKFTAGEIRMTMLEDAVQGLEAAKVLQEVVESTNILATYVDKVREKRGLDAQIKELNREIENLEQLAVDELINRGLQNVKLASGETVYLNKDFYASLVNDDNNEKAGAHAAFKRARLGDLVKPNVNISSLKAYIRELRNNGKQLPPSVRKWVKITDVNKVGVRSGS